MYVRAVLGVCCFFLWFNPSPGFAGFRFKDDECLRELLISYLANTDSKIWIGCCPKLAFLFFVVFEFDLKGFACMAERSDNGETFTFPFGLLSIVFHLRHGRQAAFHFVSL